MSAIKANRAFDIDQGSALGLITSYLGISQGDAWDVMDVMEARGWDWEDDWEKKIMLHYADLIAKELGYA